MVTIHNINLIAAVLVHPDLPRVLRELRDEYAKTLDAMPDGVAFGDAFTHQTHRRLAECDALLRDDNSADINPENTVLTIAAHYLSWPEDKGMDTVFEAANF